MMNKIKNALTGKSEMEKNVEELNIVKSRIAEVQAHLSDLSVIRKGIELELTLGADSALEKRFKKLTTAEEKAEKDVQEFEGRKDELIQAIAEEEEQQRLAQVEEAKQTFEQQVYEAHKISVLKQEMERLLPVYDSKDGLVDPRVIKSLVGLRYDENFNPADSAHRELMQAASEAGEAGKERAQKEVDEVVKKLKEIVGLN